MGAWRARDQLQEARYKSNCFVLRISFSAGNEITRTENEGKQDCVLIYAYPRIRFQAGPKFFHSLNEEPLSGVLCGAGGGAGAGGGWWAEARPLGASRLQGGWLGFVN